MTDRQDRPVRVAVLTPNPAIDVTYRVPSTTAGRTHRVVDPLRRAGGKGVNVARVARLLGASTTSVLPLGGTGGDWMAERLRVEGDTALVCPVDGETRTTVTVVDDAGRATVYAEPGRPLAGADWHHVLALVRRAVAAADALVISGSLPPDTDPEQVGAWVTAARERNIPSIVDTTGAALVAAARAGATVLKPNEAELRASIEGRGTEQRMARLIRLGAGLVVVTRGAHGVIATDGAESWHVPAIPGVEGNPTGAGDAATAALAVALARSEPIPTCLRWANAAGAAAVLAPAAGELDPPTFHRFRTAERQP